MRCQALSRLERFSVQHVGKHDITSYLLDAFFGWFSAISTHDTLVAILNARSILDAQSFPTVHAQIVWRIPRSIGYFRNDI